MDIREHAPPRQSKRAVTAQTCLTTSWASNVANNHKTVSSGTTLLSTDSNPFVDRFLEWMGSREGQQCIEIHDVLWDLLEDVQLDAKRRQLIWPDAKRTARKQRLDLDQSVQRIQKLRSDFARDEIEGFLLDWIDMGYDPENYSRAQLDELDKLTAKWVVDHLRKPKISKKRKRTRHS